MINRDRRDRTRRAIEPSQARADDWAPMLRNQIVPDAWSVPFVDRFASLATNFPSGHALGLGMIFPRSCDFTFQVTDATSQLWVRDGDRAVSVQRQDLEVLPWMVTERAQLLTDAGAIDVCARHVFADECRIVSEFRFSNPTGIAVTISPAWIGFFPGDQFRGKPDPIYPDTSFARRATFMRRLPAGIRGGIHVVDGPPHLPQSAVTVAATAAPAKITPWLGTRPWWSAAGVPSLKSFPDAHAPGFFALVSGPLRLAPGQSRTYQFSTELSIAWHQRPRFDWPSKRPPRADVDVLLARAKAWFAEHADVAHPPRSGSPAVDAKLMRARWALLRTGIRGLDGRFGKDVASMCWVQSGPFSTAFFWDSLFTGVALADFDPEFARGAIRSVFVDQLERDGASPEDRKNWAVPERKVYAAPQAPIASWAVERYLDRRGAIPASDTAYLTSMWPKLIANHRYWREFADRDRDGLAEWTWGGQTADDSPMYDQFTSGKNSFLPPVASVSLNSFLYQDATILGRLAQRRGRAVEASSWRKRADAIAEAMMRVLYLPSERRFWDYNHHTRSHRRTRTFYMLWPIVCGVPIPRAAKRELIEDVLLDPKQFFGPIPFPSVAYDEPTYEPGGYWRGRAWPHISFWLTEMLAREGYGDAAEEAARRVIGCQSAGATFRENMHTDPGEGAPGGVGDYNWGAAAFYLFGIGAYRRR